MKKRVALITLSTCLAMSLLGGLSGALAWFQEKVIVDDQSRLVGESQGAYFARGEGTSSSPFIINRPIHLYNLAWLQYIGYFNTSNAPFYFALDPIDDIDTLDMTGWVLPPIGTSLYPFVGNFNGNNETIANLVTDNKVAEGHIEKKPTIINANSVDSNGVLKVYQKTGNNHFLSTTVDIVGFFGIVGNYTGMAAVGAEYATANRVADVALDNLTVTSASSNSLGGIGVGYMNAQVSGMGISDSSISFANGTNPISLTGIENLSDYSTVGYAAPAYRANLSTQKTYVVVPERTTSSGTGSEGGNEHDWGGSIDFKYIFNRLDNLYEDRSKPYWRGVFSEYTTTTVSRSYVGGTVHDERSASSTTTTYFDGATSANPASFDSNLQVFDATHDKLNSYDPLEGKAAYHEVSTTSSDSYDYQYLFGGKKGYSEFQKRIESVDRINYTTEQTFTISASVTKTETKSFSGYSINIGGTYMNMSNGAIVDGSTATTYWAFVDGSDNGVDPSNTNTDRYIFTIDSSSQQRYYLMATNNNSGIGLTTNKNSATQWRCSTSGNKKYLRYRTNNYSYRYVSYNNGFSLSSSTSNSCVFAYASGSTLTETTSAQITANLNGSSSGVSYDTSTATRWIIQPTDGGVIIYTTISNVRYYLSNSGTSLVTTSSLASAALWNRSNGVLSTTVQNDTYYVTWNNNGYRLTSDSTAATTLTFGEHNDAITLPSKTYNTYSISYSWTYTSRNQRYPGTAYLNRSNNQISSSTSSVAWAFENGLTEPGRIFYLNNSTPYYLRYYNNNLTITNDASLASVWNIDSGKTYIWTVDGGSNKHLSCTGATNSNTGTWGISSSSTSLKITSSSTLSASVPGEFESTLTLTNNGVSIPETYVPLVTDGETSHKAIDKNYGYIVSGSNSVSESGLSRQSSIDPNSDYGDIRIAKYPIGNIYNSVTRGTSSDFGSVKTTSYCNGRNLGIIGRSYLSNGYVHITDGVFDTGNQGVSLPSAMSYENMGLEKYKDSRGITGYENNESTGLRKLLDSQTGIYGLHYVDGLVDPQNTFIADKVLIDGETINNFEIPRDSIDFYLHDSGFINFFAHTGYYNSNGPTNDSFFDLYEIDRTTQADNSSSSINEIKRIQTIYGKLNDDNSIDVSVPYVYVYDNGNTSSSEFASASALTGAEYVAVFEMAWINDYSANSQLTSSWKNFSLYYFEIPVNEGEYALGAVNGGQGAYLIYLDLGGNAMKYSYTNFTEYAKTLEYSFQYPLGVAIIQNSGSGESRVKDSVNAANSAAIAITSAETVSFTKEGNVITAEYDSNASDITFIGVNLIMKKAGADPPNDDIEVTAEASLTKTIEYFRYTIVAYNLTLKRYELTELTKTVTTESGSSATTVYSGRTSLNQGSSWTNMTTANATTAINGLNSGTGIGDVSDHDVIVLFATAVPYAEGEELGDTPISFIVTYSEIAPQQGSLDRFQELIGYSFTIGNPSSTNTLTITILSVLVDDDGNLVYIVTINDPPVTVTPPTQPPQTIPVGPAGQ